MHQILEWLSSETATLIEVLGLWGIFVGMVLESACIPIPSEVIMLSGGFLVGQGKLSFIAVVLAGVLGNVLGSALAYWVGAAGGRSFLKKYGKYVFFREHHLQQAERWFQRYGEWTVFFTRNLPFIRTFISLPAGIARMGFKKFIGFTFLGCIPWNAALTYLGLKLGSNWQAVEPYTRPVSYAVAAAVIILLGRWIFLMIRGHKKA